jgi:hypothetical protein
VNGSGNAALSINWLTIRKFAEETGYSEWAVRGKIRDGVWLEGEQWIKARDNRVLISIEGYNRWVESSLVYAPSRSRRSRSPSRFGASGAGSEFSESPPPLI